MFESRAGSSRIAPVISCTGIASDDTKYKIINNEAKCQSALIRHGYCPIDMRIFGSGKCGIRACNVTEEYRSYKVAADRIMLSVYPFPSRIRLLRVCTGASHRISVSSMCPMCSRDYKDVFGISSSQLLVHFAR
jgi:hypothetical protein